MCLRESGAHFEKERNEHLLIPLVPRELRLKNFGPGLEGLDFDVGSQMPNWVMLDRTN